MPKAFIAGCAGLALDADERAFLRDADPWGLILFKRNVADRGQLRALTAAFRECVGRGDAPVLIDQEGGRVQRMGPPEWGAFPAAGRVGAGFAPDLADASARLIGRLIAHDLSEVGITVDCAPVLDVAEAGTHAVIGARAWGHDPVRVAALGRAFAEGLLAGGVAPVIKHIPGHGRARADSHRELPVVEASRAELARDFAPFEALADLPMAMTAHVVYRAIDPDRPATASRIVVEQVMRGEIGFGGLIMSDDLSMNALTGGFEARARAVFEAGLDLALHCNGDLAEGRAVASAAPALAGKSLARAAAALATIRAPEPFDLERARADLAAINDRLGSLA
ncbi:beta-N-acetylhexosaminidase [Roseiarcus fermentans]|uniref:beta-N-acetylhexosaminidase n=1 Tax=Roseiarcus fermentans TaxID=1473586 RepID=A0A366EG20_9HYPH|nr:beta-N-acetylhexosaminidase [Roseiarcus fermentans]RBP00966.1 beta-N-acetylhexosaminidase [Roseiarcus fermentans]